MVLGGIRGCLGCILCQERLRSSSKVDECKPLPSIRTCGTRAAFRQGLTLVHVRAQLEQLQDTFMS